MAIISKTFNGMCHECGKETEWNVVHRFIDHWGITHCLECAECGKVVPDFAFGRYLSEGKVVIPV